MPTTFDWQGHRGSRGLYPENTIPAMLHAIDLGVTTLEMDAVITKDRQVVLSHEPFFNHEITTLPNGETVTEKEEKDHNIYKLNYNEVKDYDVGIKPHPRFPDQKKLRVFKPRLADVIDQVEEYKNYPIWYNIETKTKPSTDNIYHPPPAEFITLLLQVIEEKGIRDRVIIQSFDIRTLQYLHKHYPLVKTALLVESVGGVKQNIEELGFTPDIYSPEHRLVSPATVTKCREMGMKIIPWTVNEVKRMKKLKSWGVDGIITDYPNLIF